MFENYEDYKSTKEQAKIGNPYAIYRLNQYNKQTSNNYYEQVYQSETKEETKQPYADLTVADFEKMSLAEKTQVHRQNFEKYRELVRKGRTFN